MSDILDVDDVLQSAASFVRALEMLTRQRHSVFADSGDSDAIAVICYAALDKLDEARALLTKKRVAMGADNEAA